MCNLASLSEAIACLLPLLTLEKKFLLNKAIGWYYFLVASCTTEPNHSRTKFFKWKVVEDRVWNYKQILDALSHLLLQGISACSCHFLRRTLTVWDQSLTSNKTQRSVKSLRAWQQAQPLNPFCLCLAGFRGRFTSPALSPAVVRMYERAGQELLNGNTLFWHPFSEFLLTPCYCHKILYPIRINSTS